MTVHFGVSLNGDAQRKMQMFVTELKGSSPAHTAVAALYTLGRSSHNSIHVGNHMIPYMGRENSTVPDCFNFHL